MYQNWKTVNSVTVYHQYKEVFYEDFSQAVRDFSWQIAILCDAIPVDPRWRKYYLSNFKIVDELGITIPYWRIVEEFDKLGGYKPHRRLRRRFKFRQGSVEGIRKHRGGRWRWRLPHTTQEIRENDFLEYDDEACEYNIKCRRGRNRVPTSWDDLNRSDWKNHSWKRHRRHQWKSNC